MQGTDKQFFNLKFVSTNKIEISANKVIEENVILSP
jgi:hypothetical protein